ncbi:hypothetical protein CDL15_Pgr010828 [Punica granatum]|uniref:Uncharacterized protein n=1 Tax=Punica granatum TaxID=22663 RepID=A0A218W6G6_PUNGR|nr:hypothetical protein CDL15_Pgr010828 [Punica granatum]PKI63781.1 hypothetical protein CRG98_015765 [Punica granatum]
MESVSKPCRLAETKLNVQLDNGSCAQPDPDILTESDNKADFSSSGIVIAGINFVVGNSLNVLPQWASIPNSILRYLIVSVWIAFMSSLLSLRLHRMKAAALFKYVSLAFTTSTSAILWYYLFIIPLGSRFTGRGRYVAY